MVVVGGSVWESDSLPDLGQVLRNQQSSGGIVAGICGGTLALARAGFLEDVLHTSNNAGYLSENAKEYSGHNYFRASASAVSDKRVITAPGTAPVSFTAAIFESLGLDADTVHQFRGMLAAEHE